MKKFTLFFLCLIPFIQHAQTSTPDWSTGVAPIFFNKCASCHHANGIAPFDITVYSTAVAQAASIANATTNGIMPPWPPDPTYSTLAHQRVLTAQEISAISAWVSGNTPLGDTNLAPPRPVFNSGAILPGKPDLSVRIPTYTVGSIPGSDMYRCFDIYTSLTTDEYITAMECIPGNPQAVHHIVIYADTTETCHKLDSVSGGSGYISFGGTGSSTSFMLGVWAPGVQPYTYPSGMVFKLPKHSHIVLQIHYPAASAGLVDSSRLNLFFSTSPPASLRQLYIQPILNYQTDMTNGPISIPADSQRTYYEHYKIPSYATVSVLAVLPHMHLIGRSYEVFGVSPTNDTLKCVRINDWQFRWQGNYFFPKIQKVLGGTNLWAKAFYDNTVNNPYNPNNPPKDVVAGENTTDEMMLVYFIYTLYQPGDENIIIDSAEALGNANIKATLYSTAELFPCYPNPAQQYITIKYFLQNAATCNLSIYDMQGHAVWQKTYQNHAQGYSLERADINTLAAGTYLVTLKTDKGTRTVRFVKTL